MHHRQPVSQPAGAAAEGSPAASWRALMIICAATDVQISRADSSVAQVKAAMSPAIRSEVERVARRFEIAAADWSAGNVEIDLSIADAETELNAVEHHSGNLYWVSPACVRAEIERHAPAGAFDSIFVVFEPRGIDGMTIPLAGWGLAVPPRADANGAGFASIMTPPSAEHWRSEPYPEEVFVHEWLHQVIGFHSAAGRLEFDLHDVDRFGYRAVEGSWQAWYRDILAGRIPTATGFAGIDRQTWAAGTPRSSISG